jgi:hypothetical protein
LRKLYSAITMPSVTFAVLQPCTAMLRHRHDTALTNSHNREPRIEAASRTWRVFDFMFQQMYGWAPLESLCDGTGLNGIERNRLERDRKGEEARWDEHLFLVSALRVSFMLPSFLTSHSTRYRSTNTSTPFDPHQDLVRSSTLRLCHAVFNPAAARDASHPRTAPYSRHTDR